MSAKHNNNTDYPWIKFYDNYLNKGEQGKYNLDQEFGLVESACMEVIEDFLHRLELERKGIIDAGIPSKSFSKYADVLINSQKMGDFLKEMVRDAPFAIRFLISFIEKNELEDQVNLNLKKIREHSGMMFLQGKY